MRFAHIADVHLGKRVDIGTPFEEESTREIYDGFVAFVDHIELNPVEFIFITGDLFDHVPNRNELVYVDTLLSKLENTYIIYITGECDFLKRGAEMWKYKFVSNMFLLNLDDFKNNSRCQDAAARTNYVDGMVDCIHFDKYNVDIYGICQYSDINYRNDFDTIYARNLKRINILLAHGGSKTVAPYDPEDMLSKNFAYIGMGHFHTYRVYKDKKIYYPGSLEPLCSEGDGHHGYIKGYIDEFITDIKFVPLSHRQYETIAILADKETTNDDILNEVSHICKGNKGYIYSVVINRDADCITDYDLTQLRKKYRILDVEGEKCYKDKVIKLEQLNGDNILGKTIKRLSNSGNEQSVSVSVSVNAMVKYGVKMSEKLWEKDDQGLRVESADEETALKAHEEVFADLREELSRIEEGLEMCGTELERFNDEFKEHPDMTGEINVARANLLDIEFKINDVEFKDSQVNEIYRRERVGFIVALNLPVIIAVIIFSLLTFGSAAIDLWMDDWLLTIVYTMIFVAINSFVLYRIYNKTQNARGKLSGKKTASQKHADNGNALSGMYEIHEGIINELKELDEKQNEYMYIHDRIKGVNKKREELINKSKIIMQIIQ